MGGASYLLFSTLHPVQSSAVEVTQEMTGTMRFQMFQYWPRISLGTWNSASLNTPGLGLSKMHVPMGLDKRPCSFNKNRHQWDWG